MACSPLTYCSRCSFAREAEPLRLKGPDFVICLASPAGRHPVRGDEGHRLRRKTSVCGEFLQVLPPGAEGPQQGVDHRVQQVRLHQHLQLARRRARKEENIYGRGAAAYAEEGEPRRRSELAELSITAVCVAQEKKKIKADRDAAEAPYTTCVMDGRVEKARGSLTVLHRRGYMHFIVDLSLACMQVGNFRVEPPGLFRGRGEHPKMGLIKVCLVRV